jgi:hypothetical protein
MRAELKALAKKSLEEELSQLRSTHQNNNDLDYHDNHDGLEEVQYFQHLIGDMHRTQQVTPMIGGAPMQWSSPIVRDQRTTPRRPTAPETPLSPPFTQETHGRKTANSTYRSMSPQNESSNLNQSSFFVLSSAPINGFDTLIHKQIASRESNDAPNSLIEQANRYAEINNLFQMPSVSIEEDFWFKKQFDEYNAAMELEKEKQKDQVKQQRKKLENTIEQHVERLNKARYVPVKFPMDAKPSSALMSPRARSQRLKNTQVQTEASTSTNTGELSSTTVTTTVTSPPNITATTTTQTNSAKNSNSSSSGKNVTPGPIGNATSAEGYISRSSSSSLASEKIPKFHAEGSQRMSSKPVPTNAEHNPANSTPANIYKTMNTSSKTPVVSVEEFTEKTEK